jgi:hypothetical protein
MESSSKERELMQAHFEEFILSVWQDRNGAWHGQVQRHEPLEVRTVAKLSRSPAGDIDLRDTQDTVYALARTFAGRLSSAQATGLGTHAASGLNWIADGPAN